MVLRGENWSAQRKTCPRATLFAINPIWVDLRLNLGLHNHRPVTDLLRQHSQAKSGWIVIWTSAFSNAKQFWKTNTTVSFFIYLKELQQCVWICRHFHSQHDGGQGDITVVNICVSEPRQKTSNFRHVHYPNGCLLKLLCPSAST